MVTVDRNPQPVQQEDRQSRTREVPREAAEDTRQRYSPGRDRPPSRRIARAGRPEGPGQGQGGPVRLPGLDPSVRSTQGIPRLSDLSSPASSPDRHPTSRRATRMCRSTFRPSSTGPTMLALTDREIEYGKDRIVPRLKPDQAAWAANLAQAAKAPQGMTGRDIGSATVASRVTQRAAAVDSESFSPSSATCGKKALPVDLERRLDDRLVRC